MTIPLFISHSTDNFVQKDSSASLACHWYAHLKFPQQTYHVHQTDSLQNLEVLNPFHLRTC